MIELRNQNGVRLTGIDYFKPTYITDPRTDLSKGDVYNWTLSPTLIMSSPRKPSLESGELGNRIPLSASLKNLSS